MIIQTKYDIGQKLYSTSKFNSDHFYIENKDFIIVGIMYINNNLHYKLSFDDSTLWVKESCIDNVENGYYFTSAVLQKSCDIANGKK